MLKTPVVLIIFKRPDLTKLVVDALERVRPETLLVVADGPRASVKGEREATEATRAVIDRISWNCEILRNYSDENLGCGRRPATGISWALEQVPEAIILEDDCVPHPSFFRFCEELLERYRDDERIMHVAGSTYRRAPLETPYSYVFSRINGAWGWATWRRAWRHFDLAVSQWAELRGTPWLSRILDDEQVVRAWAREFDVALERKGDVSYWDHQWTFACWAQNGLSITPRVNLVTNVGWGVESTHNFSEHDPLCNLPTSEMVFPLLHPPSVLRSQEADRQFIREVLAPRLWKPSAVRMLASRMAPAFIKARFKRAATAVGAVAQELLHWL
jgi:hypothetical protein